MRTDSAHEASAAGPALPTTLFDALQSAARRWPDSDFVVVDHRARVATYGEILDRSTKLANMLSDRGVGPGDRVCLAMANSEEWVVTAFAVSAVGAVFVPLSTRLVDREVRHCLELVQPRAVIVHDVVRGRQLVDEWPSLKVATEAGEAIDVLVYSGLADVSRLPCGTATKSGTHNALAPVPPELVGAAAIIFTSGTTSAPKGVILTHAGLLRVAYETGRRQTVGHHDRFLSVAPLFHCSGFMHALLTCLMAGATLFTASRFVPEDALRLIREERITVAHGPLPMPPIPANLQRTNAFPSFARAWTGGTSEQLQDLEEALGVTTCSLWGMTETCGCHALTEASDSAQVRHGSAGRPMPGLEFRIVANGVDVASDGVLGELEVRGWNVTPGYFRDPVATAAAIRPDGWLRTGDLAERVSDGRFRFIGRKKDIIRVGGENLSPVEVESVILTLPGVVDAAVVCSPDPKLGEVPVAAIMIESGVVVTAEQLHEHCASRLADFKVPREFFRADTIPRTHATNRIQRSRVQTDISAGRMPHVA